MKASHPSILARALQGFLTDFLPKQRAISTNTILSYRDALKLLLRFIAGKGDTSAIKLEDISVERITAFLSYLEKTRGNSATTRNVRLNAIHTFFRYVGDNYPEYLAQSQRVRGIPRKRAKSRFIQYMESGELEAMLGGINRSARNSHRDITLLSLLFNTGGRVSEIVGLLASDLDLGDTPSVHFRGKGSKGRDCPLWPETARLLRALLEEQGIDPNQPTLVFRNYRGAPLTRFGVRVILRKHVRRTTRVVANLARKRIHTHTLRHSTAVHLLRSGVDLVSIANWLGHASVNTTNKYLALDIEAKREALGKAKPLLGVKRKPVAWRRDRDLIGWLEQLCNPSTKGLNNVDQKIPLPR